jgi:hypothetical protein
MMRRAFAFLVVLPRRLLSLLWLFSAPPETRSMVT